MSFYNVDAHDMQSCARQDPSTKDRIIKWIRQLEYLQSPIISEAEDTHAPSTVTAMAASQAVSRAPSLLRLPVDEAVEELLPVTRSRITHPNQRSGTTGPASERGHPLAPVMQTIPLPQITEIETPSRSTTASKSRSIGNYAAGHPFGHPQNGTPHYQGGISGAHQVHHRPPSSMLAAAVPTGANPPAGYHFGLGQEIICYLNASLRYHESLRAVVKPLLSDMPPYPGHCWGARDEDGICEGALNIHFAYSTIPATYPPKTRMRLARPFGGKLIVTPTVGNQFVSVGDVQKAVIAWMRWEQPHVQDEGFRLTGREIARARDDTTVSVEVWVWRGLTSVGGDLWEIHL